MLGAKLTFLGFVAVFVDRDLRAQEWNAPAYDVRTVLGDGDAHRLNELLGVNEFLVESPTVAELKMALRRENGRAHRFRSA